MTLSYLEWNDALTGYFFKPEAEGRPVWLYFNEEVIAQVGASLGAGGVEEFVAAIKDGPPWPTPDGLCQKALKTCEKWQERGLEYPPYLAFLGLFVLAAGLEGNFAAHAYYPRLRTLLGEPPTTGELPSFHRMYELWDDLERWSVRDLKGALGLFEARIAGGMFHIGLPLAQSVLTDQERKALTRIFADSEFDPSAPPPDGELLRALRTHGPGLLRPRTLRLLSGAGEREALDVLVDLVAEELSEWNGEALVEEEAAGSGSHVRVVHAALRLCLRLDRPAGRVQAFLRCSLNRREFPDAGLMFSLPGIGTPASCGEEIPGWSTPLIESAVDTVVDASHLDWIGGMSARDVRLGWRFRFPSGKVRVLVSGEGIGLSGLVEVHQLPRDQPFYLAFQQEAWPHIEQWTRESCHGFEILTISEGLPVGWQLASASLVTKDDAELSSRYPSLALPARATLRSVGGIRSSTGNNFFAFARPRILVEGGEGSEEVHCNNQVLTPIHGTAFYELPEGLPNDVRILIEVTRGGEVLKRQSIYLTGGFNWNIREPLEAYDEWGNAAEPTNQQPVVSGAHLMGDPSRANTFKRSILLVPGLKASLDRRVFFVGRVPGQITTWPAEPLPEGWEPVWAVPMDRRGIALYCGGSLDESSPLRTGLMDRERVERWKQILWHWRKRIVAPTQRSLALLWKQYAEAARHA